MNRSKDFLVQLALNLLIFSLVACKTCVKENSCKCNGGVWGIDLSSLAVGDPPKFSIDISSGNETKSTLYYHPCNNFWIKDASKGKCGKDGTAVCIENENIASGTKDYINAGVQDLATFETNSDASAIDVKIIYKYGENETILSLKCVLDSKTDTLTLDSSPTQTDPAYHLTLASKCSCPNGCYHTPQSGLSVGSVLLILFFVIVALYLTVGMFYNACIMGATGFEIVPNYEFWIDFPFLVRDGIVFAMHCCKTEAAYDRI